MEKNGLILNIGADMSIFGKLYISQQNTHGIKYKTENDTARRRKGA